MDLLKNQTLTLHITGGATKAMMNNTDVYRNKHLYPADGEVEIESDYRVVPLGASLDIDEFIGVLKHDIGL